MYVAYEKQCALKWIALTKISASNAVEKRFVLYINKHTESVCLLDLALDYGPRVCGQNTSSSYNMRLSEAEVRLQGINVSG